MTLCEKIGQLNLLAAGEGLVTGAKQPTSLAARLDAGQVGAIFGTKSLATARAMQERALAGSRLKIPLFFAEDVIHGHRTVFPLNIALACSWDPDLIEETSAFAAAEAAAEGLHQVYAPMIDVSRDARWGRVAEGPGEDPLLASRLAAAATRGFQGRDIGGAGRVAACLKHFVAYGAPESGRDYDNVSLAWEDLLALYLPPFAAGVAAGAASVMVSFNAVNKVPMHANGQLIEGWLRGQTGFDGLVVSDYTGVAELVPHGLGAAATVVARAIHAGVDMDMVGEDFLRELPALARDGLVAPDAGLSLSPEQIAQLIDRACLRVLTFKARLGLLDDPFRGMAETARAPSRQDGRKLARKAAARAAVLLKNDGVLPLSSDIDVALIGPFAADRANMLGTWAVSGRAEDVVPLHEAVAALTGQPPARAWGANIVDEDWLVGRLNVHGVTVTQDPRPEDELIAEADAVLYAWHGGIAGPEGVADLLFGAASPSGRLAMTLPAHPGEVPLSYASDPTGRPYQGRFAKFRTGWLDMPDDAPRFPFGFGLGYGQIAYGAPSLSQDSAEAGQTVELRIALENTGQAEAIETVQLYASDPIARRTLPGRALIDFRQVTLAPGQSCEVVFAISAGQFAYPVAPALEAADWVRDPGLIQLHVGPNSRDTQTVELTWLD